MFERDLLRTWRNSLVLARPSNLKLFLLVSMKTWLEALFLFCKFVGLWYLAAFAVLYAVPHWNVYVDTILFKILFSIPMFLAVRPSLERKNLLYFKRYAHRALGIIVLSVGVMSILFSLFFSVNLFLAKSGLYYFYCFYGIGSLIIPLLIFSSFFFLDSDGSPLSLWSSFVQGLKMLVYYFPIVIVVGMVGLLIFLIDFSFVIGSLMTVLRSMLQLFLFSFLANYYTKIKYSNYQLFFAA